MLPESIRAEHETEWRSWFGEYDEWAVYRPSQTERPGVALLLLRAGISRGFVKLRPEWDARVEQLATSRLNEAETFTAPTVVGLHSSGGWTSLGLTALPGRIHSPRIPAPIRAIAEEASELIRLAAPCPPGWRPMHGDFGPWNLRRMRGIGPVLFDWEHAAPAPPLADLVFYAAAAKAVGLSVQIESEFSDEAVAFWREEIPRRFGRDRRDDRLARSMLEVLGTSEPIPKC
ncbi:MAG: phosphotransferase family protein [Actinomycetota bacterium]